MKPLPRTFVAYMLSILLSIPVALAFVPLVGWNGAALMGQGMLLAVILVTATWIIAVDSRKRWPELTTVERATRILTFQR